MKRYFDIEHAKQVLKSPLFGNRYIVSFAGVGSLTQGLFDKNIGFLVNTISMPTVNFNMKVHYVGGINVSIPTVIEQGQLDFTMYNTGNEYNTIKKWCDCVYNPKTRSYGYINDTLISVNIMEFDKAANKILTHKFDGCSLFQFGGTQLTYEESTTVETFQLSLHYRGYTVELN